MRNRLSPAPRTGNGRKRRLLFEPFAACSSVSQLGPVRLDMSGMDRRRSRLHAHTRGSLCGTSCHLLARVRCSSRADFRSLRKNGTRHPTPAPPRRTTHHWTTGHVHRTLLVVAWLHLPICLLCTVVRGTGNGDHALAVDWPCRPLLRAIFLSCPPRRHARTHALIMIALMPRAWSNSRCSRTLLTPPSLSIACAFLSVFRLDKQGHKAHRMPRMLACAPCRRAP